MAAGLLRISLALAALSVSLALQTRGDPSSDVDDPSSAPAPPECIKPIEGEKLIYLVVNGEAVDDRDGVLTEKGKKWAGDLGQDPNLQLALSQEKFGRAAVVIMSPLRRAMETAMLGFREKLPDAKWEISEELVGNLINDIDPEAGGAYLSSIRAAPDVVQQYEKASKAEPIVEIEDKPDHMQRFAKQLFDRPEKTFIVVATEYEALLMNARVRTGETELMALTHERGLISKKAFGAFHPLTDPAFWKDCVQKPNAGMSWQDDMAKNMGRDREVEPPWMNTMMGHKN